MGHVIRRACEHDSGFIAWVMQEAARSHLPLGFWDLAFPGPDADRLRIIGRVVRARARSLCHWSGFLVVDVDGQPAAGLSGYETPSVSAGPAFVEAMQEALAAEGWTGEQLEAMRQRTAPFLTCLPETPEEAWVVEWVATRPAYRGRGLVKALLHEVLAQGRERGHTLAQISVLIDNVPAQRAYEGVGFRVVDEKRHPEFEAAIGSPGIRRLLR